MSTLTCTLSPCGYAAGTDPEPTAAASVPPPPAPPPACTPYDPEPVQTLGPGAVTTYDAWRRSQYTSTIGQRSLQALGEIDAAEAAGDRGAAWRAAQEASEARNATRTATQGRLTPAGRIVSDRLEGDRSWGYITNRYDPAGTQDYAAARRIAEASGRSARLMKYFSGFSRVAGPVGIVVGGAVAANEVAQACPADRPRVAASEAGGMALGAAGAVGGTVLAVALLGSNPVGWAVLGAAVIGSAVGGWLGSEGGRAAGGAIFDFFAR